MTLAKDMLRLFIAGNFPVFTQHVVWPLEASGEDAPVVDPRIHEAVTVLLVHAMPLNASTLTGM